MSASLLATLGLVLYPLASAALCVWLGWSLQRLYLAWSEGELSSARFYALLLRAGFSSLSLLSLLLWVAARWSGRSLLPLLLGLALLWAEPALAQSLPRLTLPDNAGADGDILGTFTTLAVYGGRILVLMLSITGICGISWQVVLAFMRARDSGDWGQFGVVFVIGAIVMLTLTGMGQFGWSYLDSLQGL